MINGIHNRVLLPILHREQEIIFPEEARDLDQHPCVECRYLTQEHRSRWCTQPGVVRDYQTRYRIAYFASGHRVPEFAPIAVAWALCYGEFRREI